MRLKPSGAVVGLVADEDHRRGAGLLGGVQRDGDQPAADADILVGRPHGERPEQQRPPLAGGDAGQADRGDHRAVM